MKVTCVAFVHIFISNYDISCASGMPLCDAITWHESCPAVWKARGGYDLRASLCDAKVRSTRHR